MEIYSRENVIGSKIDLKVNNTKHIRENNPDLLKATDSSESFAKILFNAVETANSLQHKADDLETLMTVAPEEVNIDEVIIASEKARLNVSFMKTIIEKAIKAYNDIMTIR